MMDQMTTKTVKVDPMSQPSPHSDLASPNPSEQESNNNNNFATNGGDTNHDDHEKHNEYDVLGANDQELAMHQYLEEDEEFDQDEREKLSTSRPAEASEREEGAFDEGEDDDDDDDEDNFDGHNGVDGEIDGGDRRALLSSNGRSKSQMMEGDKVGAISNLNGQTDGDNQKQQQLNHADISGEQTSAEPEQMRKLFIGGLDYRTSEATLRQHFEKFGDVIDCVVMREPQSRRSRGFGFVIYASSSMVDKAQEARPHEIDGREVQPKRAISREDSGKPEAKTTVKKVYLGGLSDDIEEPELRDYFKSYGNIVNVNILVHKDTGKRRGFAFVEFDDYDPVDKIVLKKFHTIRDKRMEARKAIPKNEMDARKRGGDPRVALAGAMIALSRPLDAPPSGRLPRSGRSGSGGGAASGFWDGPYSAGGYPPAGYSNPANLDGYPHHYHSPPAHYGASSWMLHGGSGGGGGQGGGGGPYGGFRGGHGYGRNGYGGAGQGGNWPASAVDYATFPAAQGEGGGPMRLNYHHRWEPYGGGFGAHRGRGYNPRS